MPGPVMPRATSGLGDVLRRLGIQLPVTPEASARQPWQDMPGSQPRPVLDNILGALVDFPRGMVTGGGAEPGMSWENAGAAVGALAPLLGPLLGKIVYHGSPHVFDKFDMSKVGTGQGAQAQGHGLYFADKPGVAKVYRPEAGSGASPADMAERLLDAVGRDPDLAIAELQRRLANWEATDGRFKSPGFDETVKYAIEAIRRGETRPGMLAEVDLPDDAIAKMIDYDAPISQQPPEVQAIARELGFTGRSGRGDVYDPTGQILYDAAATKRWLDSHPTSSENPGRAQEAASTWLRERGIPGIRYQDQQSRGFRILPPEQARTGKWTVGMPNGDKTRYFETQAEAQRYFDEQVSRNYVVFDDQLPKIVKVER